MIKIIGIINLLIGFLILLPININRVYALGTCSMRTEPNPLISTASSAKFLVNVGDTANYPSYKMEFQCGAPQTKAVATKEPPSNIYRTLDNTFILGQQSCEFSATEGTTHTIKVLAVVGGQDVEQCIASYEVIDADTNCVLTINPTSGITSATNLAVSGENLTTGGQFVFFFDDDAIDIPNNPAGRFLIQSVGAANVNAPTFGPKSIPTDLLTPGTHTVSLRRRNTLAYSTDPINSPIINQLKPEKDYFSAPLCPPVAFSVGTPTNPGKVFLPGTNSTTSQCIDPAKCTKAGGIPCGANGFQTAIGCIQATPAEFVKDFMTFIIGISGGLAFLMMLLGAFQMLTSAGNPETLAAGKDRFTNAIIGLLFIIFAVLLMQIIGFDILKLPGFGR